MKSASGPDLVFFRDGEAIGDGIVIDTGEGAPYALLTPRPALELIRPAVREFIDVAKLIERGGASTDDARDCR